MSWPASKTSLIGPGWRKLELIIAGYRLTAGPRDPAVESLRFPGLVNAYRSCCPLPERPPRQDDYEDWVLELVLRDWDDSRPRPDVAAVRARAGRAYISLVVQHHAYLVLQYAFGVVAWDDDLDMRLGVDLVVIGCDAVAVGIALRAPTPRSREMAARKATRYRNLPFTVHTLEVEPHAYTAGPFWLYRPEVLELVVTNALAQHWEAKASALEAAASLAYSDGQRRPKASRRDFMDGVKAALTALRAT